jgi:hypothetical protein
VPRRRPFHPKKIPSRWTHLRKTDYAEQSLRRNFLRSTAAGTVGLAALDPLQLVASAEAIISIHSASFSTAPSKRGIEFSASNGLKRELVVSENRLLGIGAVTLNGKSLRNNAENIWPEIATPYSEEIAYLELLGATEHDGALVVSTQPYYRIGHRMEWTEQLPTPQSTWARDLDRHWRNKRPISTGSCHIDETHDDIAYAGFSYGFHYSGPKHPIYQIEDKATWELSGHAVGNGFIMRGANAPHIRFAGQTPMYSGWDFAQSPNPHILQPKPLHTQLQGITFQYDAEDVLLTSLNGPRTSGAFTSVSLAITHRPLQPNVLRLRG